MFNINFKKLIIFIFIIRVNILLNVLERIDYLLGIIELYGC